MEIIKQLREKNNYNQQKLASMLNVSRSTVAMWETGKSEPNKEILLQISKIFDVSLDYLLGQTDVPYHDQEMSLDLARLGDLRRTYRLSKKDLAEIVGVCETNMSQYENGERLPSYRTLSKMCDYFHVSLDYLLGRTDVSTPEQGETLTPDEAVYLQKYRSLDTTGKEKAGEYLADLAKLYSNVVYFPGGHAATDGDTVPPEVVDKANQVREI